MAHAHFVLAQFGIYVSAFAFRCGPVTYFTHDRGTIKSHVGYDAGHNYGRNLDCMWTIEGPPARYVNLIAEDFTLEANSL